MAKWSSLMLMAIPVILAAAPVTKPAATKPTMVDLKPLEAKVADALAAVEDAKAKTRSRWEDSDEYKRMKGQTDQLRKALEAARAGDDPKAKLDASKAYNDARLALAKREATELRDAGKDELAAVERARSALAEAIEHNRVVEEASPIRQAIRARKVIRGMNREQVEEMFGRPTETSESPRGTTCIYQVKGPIRYSNDDPRIRAVQIDPGTTAINPPGPEPREVKREIVVVFKDGQVADFRDTKLRD